jgi:pyruvate formate lyase activating enzyme
MASDTVEIKGLQKTSLIDYPGKVCAVVFFGGCDFRCLFCYNVELVLNPERLKTIPEEEFLEFQKKRKKWLDGIVLGGGEPCIQQNLPGFIRKIKNLGFLVKLDTNGSKPEMLEKLLKENLLDYIAMDIKSPLEKYDKAAGVKVNKKAIQKSIDLIRNSGVDYEFRTTVVPRFLDKNDLFIIGKWLKGSKRFFIQQFRSQTTINPEFQKEKSFKPEELNEFKDMLKPYFEEVEVRGV